MTTVAHRAAPLRHGPRFGMAWVTWRQHRAALAGACGLRALMILYMLVTGLHMRSALSSLGLNTCHPLTGARSATAVGLFNNDHDVWRNNGLVVMRIVPLLAGVFTGDRNMAIDRPATPHLPAGSVPVAVARRRSGCHAL